MRYWIRRGWLKAKRFPPQSQRWMIEPEEARRFLEASGVWRHLSVEVRTRLECGPKVENLREAFIAAREARERDGDDDA